MSEQIDTITSQNQDNGKEKIPSASVDSSMKSPTNSILKVVDKSPIHSSEENGALKKALQDIRHAKNIMEKVLETQKSRIEMLEREIQKYKENELANQEEIEKLQSQIHALQNNLKKYAQQVESLQKEIKDLNQIRKEMLESLKSERSEKEELRIQNNLYGEEIVDLKRTLEQIEPIIDQLQKDMQRQNSTVQDTPEPPQAHIYLEEIRFLKEENHQLKQHIDAIQNRELKGIESETFEQMKKDLDRVKEENAKLQLILKAEKVKIGNLTEELRDVKRTANPMEPKADSVKQENKICDKCGKVNVPVAIFCSACGSSLSSKSAQNVTFVQYPDDDEETNSSAIDPNSSSKSSLNRSFRKIFGGKK